MKKPAPHGVSSVLDEVNYLLKSVGSISKRITSIEELTRVASSMFVAIFESLFFVRLEGVIRNPISRTDYIINAQRVIDQLSLRIDMDLQHITGESIVNGDIRSLSNLIHILFRIQSIRTKTASSSPSMPFGRPQLESRSNVGSDSITTHESDRLLRPIRMSRSSKGMLRMRSRPNKHPSMSLGGLRNRKCSNSAARRASHKVAKVQRNEDEDDDDNDDDGDRYEGYNQYIKFDDEPFVLETQRSIRMVQRRMAIEQRLEAARKRREHVLKQREKRALESNTKDRRISEEALHRRWLNETEREQNAFLARRQSQEQLMLSKLYRNLIKKMQEWRHDESAESREKLEQMRESARCHLKSLQGVFDDRIKLLKEKEATSRVESDLFTRACRRMNTELSRSNSLDLDSMMKSRKSFVEQTREKQLHYRQDSHRTLLSFINAANFMDAN